MDWTGNSVNYATLVYVLCMSCSYLTEFSSFQVRIEEKDKRQDLFALATSYIGQLKARWSTLVAEDEFHEKVSNPEKPVKSRPVKEDKEGGGTISSTSEKSKSKSSATKVEPMEVSPASDVSSVPATTSSNSSSSSSNKTTAEPSSTSNSLSSNVVSNIKASKQSVSADSAASSPIVVWVSYSEYNHAFRKIALNWFIYECSKKDKEVADDAPVQKAKVSSSSESRREASSKGSREASESRAENTTEKSSKSSEKRSSSSRPESHSSSSSSKKDSQDVKAKKESSSDRRTSDSDRSRGMIVKLLEMCFSVNYVWIFSVYFIGFIFSDSKRRKVENSVKRRYKWVQVPNH